MGGKIEWCDETWNPISGCTKVSAGCANCYAERMAKRFVRKGISGRNGRKIKALHFRSVLLHPDSLDRPLRWKKPRRVFVCSMGDLFHEDVPDEFIKRVWSVMAEAQRHTFMVLTKRPERMLAHLAGEQRRGWKRDWPNIWLGVSAEDQRTADERIPLLLQTPAAVRFVSVEPMLGPVDFRKVPGFNLAGQAGVDLLRNFWVICGGESGPGARPMNPQWPRDLRDQCKAAGVPFLFKQWGEWVMREYEPGDPASLRDIVTGEQTMIRVGRKAAGRLLDGVLHDSYPEVRND